MMFDEMRLRLSRSLERVRCWMRHQVFSVLPKTTRARQGFVIVLFIAVGIGLIGSQAHAGLGSPEDASKWVLTLIGQFLNVIISFLFNLLTLLINILIWFASYNDFVHSEPVTIGWVLMRDVVNMFFIVVLLASAFSTIIQYKALHYSQILPKLLVMAILINFSKTLIGLLVDFSQVIMLTFVNAFRQAAAGNFITALKLTKVTSLDPNQTDVYELNKMIISAILAIVMLSLAMTVVIIMVAFLVGRIVTLWILLIMSPMAFFATALPGNLAKSLSVFTSKFWGRLSTALVGGPIMAFFLWLTLAIAQGSAKPFAEVTGPEATNAISSFSTVIGSAGEIGTFVVAVAIMLQGVEFAVSTANEISSSIGSFAKKLSAGGGVAVQALRLGARAGVGTARVGARVTGKAAGAGFEGADRLLDIRGGVGKLGLAASRRLGGLGAGTFNALAGHKAKKEKEAYDEITKLTSSMDTNTRNEYLRSIAEGTLSTGKSSNAAKLALADSASGPLTQKRLTEKFMKELEDRDDLKGESKEKLQAMAETMALQQRSKDLKAGQETAEAMGNEAKTISYKEALEKDPLLTPDWTGFADIKNKSVEDSKKYLENVKPSAMKDSRSFIAHMKALGLIDKDGNFVRDSNNKENTDTWGYLMKGEERRKIIDEQMKQFQSNPNLVKAHLDAMDGNAEQTKVADAGRFYVSGKGGKFAGVLVSGLSPSGITPAAEQVISIENQRRARIAEGQQKLKTLKDRGERANGTAAMIVKKDMLAAGAGLETAMRFDAKAGMFKDDDNKAAFKSIVGDSIKGAASGDEESLEVLSGLNMDDLKSRPGEYNEARTAVVSDIDLDAVKKAFDQAVKEDNAEAQKKLSELLELVVMEDRRVAGIMEKANVSMSYFNVLQAAPDSPQARGVAQVMQTAGMDKTEDVLTAIKARQARSRIAEDPQLIVIQENAKAAAKASRAVSREAAEVEANLAKQAREIAQNSSEVQERARQAADRAQNRAVGRGRGARAASAISGALRRGRSSPSSNNDTSL